VNSTIARSLVFLALAILTIVLAYLYQRRERVQRVRGAWIWPAVFCILALHAVARELPGDPGLLPWLAVAFPLGAAIGVVRGLAFGLETGQRLGEMRLRPTLFSGAIYVGVLCFNEFVHVWFHGQPNFPRFASAFLVLTAGNSIAVNATRLLRYRAMTALSK